MPMLIVLFRHHLTILSKTFFVLSNKDDNCSFFIANVLLLFRMIFLFFFCTIHEKLMKNSQLEFFSFFLTTLTLPSESHYFTRLVIVNFRCLDHLSPFEKASYLEMELKYQLLLHVSRLLHIF